MLFSWFWRSPSVDVTKKETDIFFSFSFSIRPPSGPRRGSWSRSWIECSGVSNFSYCMLQSFVFPADNIQGFFKSATHGPLNVNKYSMMITFNKDKGYAIYEGWCGNSWRIKMISSDSYRYLCSTENISWVVALCNPLQ